MHFHGWYGLKEQMMRKRSRLYWIELKRQLLKAHLGADNGLRFVQGALRSTKRVLYAPRLQAWGAQGEGF